MVTGATSQGVNADLTGSQICPDAFLLSAGTSPRPALPFSRVPFDSSLAPPRLRIVPGGETHCDVTVHNTGSVVDTLTFEVVGDLAEYASVDPTSVNLYPERGGRGTGTAHVRFELPRSPLVPPGRRPFGVLVRSQKDPKARHVEEGTIVVGAVREVSAELVPRTARGRRSATYELSLDNRGNTAVNAPLDGFDPDAQLRFEFFPPTVVAEPGTAATARIVVRPKKSFFRGTPQTRPFQVRAAPAEMDPLVTDGTMLHEPLVPRWAPRALMGLAAGVVALAVLWLALLRPQIKSDATRAAKKELNSPETQAAIQTAANQAAKSALDSASAASLLGSPDAQAKIADAARVAIELAGGRNAGLRGSSKDGLLQVGTSLPDSYLVPDGMELQVTDLILENPKGESGTLKVQRNDTPLMEVALENFRDLDYHFAAPLHFGAGDRLRLVADCTGCTPSLAFAGFQADLAPASTTTTR